MSGFKKYTIKPGNTFAFRLEPGHRFELIANHYKIDAHGEQILFTADKTPAHGDYICKLGDHHKLLSKAEFEQLHDVPGQAVDSIKAVIKRRSGDQDIAANAA